MLNHLFIDFDETLFNYYKFAKWLDSYLVREHGMDAAKLLNSFDEFHDVQDESGKLRLYRHVDHIKHTAGLDWGTENHKIAAAARSEGMHFCYEDAHQFIESVASSNLNKVAILTYGKSDYQMYKIKFCERLACLPVTVIEIDKGKYLKRHFGSSEIRGILVDDKAPQDLPKNWHHVWINRDNRQNPDGREHTEVNELEAASKYIAKKLVQ